MRFVVAQTGRSGSRWISRVFRRLGVSCGHESVYNAKEGFRGWRAYQGDASWPALWWLMRGEHSPDVVLHQVRAPLDVVNSLAGNNFLRLGDPSPYSQFRRKIWPELDPRDYVRAALQIWVWTTREMLRLHPHLTWKLESCDADMLRLAACAIGEPAGLSACEAAIRSVPWTINDHRKLSAANRPERTWADLPDEPLKEEAAELARELGYVEPTKSHRPE